MRFLNTYPNLILTIVIIASVVLFNQALDCFGIHTFVNPYPSWPSDCVKIYLGIKSLCFACLAAALVLLAVVYLKASDVFRYLSILYLLILLGYGSIAYISILRTYDWAQKHATQFRTNVVSAAEVECLKYGMDDDTIIELLGYEPCRREDGLSFRADGGMWYFVEFEDGGLVEIKYGRIHDKAVTVYPRSSFKTSLK